MTSFIIDAIRTPRGRGGSKGGALSGIRAADLLAGLAVEIERRNPGVAKHIDDTLIGCVTQVGDQGGNIAKAALLRADWPAGIPAATINRFCASGLSAVSMMAAQARGQDAVTLAGGVEMMSRTPMFADKGVMFTDPEVARTARAVHPILAADLVATRHGISRADCDAYAALSQQRAADAGARGAFRSIVPVRDATGAVVLAEDETIRAGVTAESLAQIEPAGTRLGTPDEIGLMQSAFPGLGPLVHVHHAGNAPAMADGASLVLLAGEAAVGRHGLKPRARILATAEASVAITQTGAVDATLKALSRAGLTAGEIDLWEVRDSFAAVTLHYLRALSVDLSRFNVNGSAIALGHPLGATGAMLVGGLLDELETRGQRLGVAAIAGAAGVASACVIECLT